MHAYSFTLGRIVTLIVYDCAAITIMYVECMQNATAMTCTIIMLHRVEFLINLTHIVILSTDINAVISTNERIEFITDHMTYNPAYT